MVVAQTRSEPSKVEIELPDLPDLIKEICKPSVDINNLGSIISKDPELVAEVIDTINAPYFNLVRKISSIDEAVRFLGQERIVKIATAKSLRTAIFKRQHAFTEELWRTSNRCAVACVLLAKELKRLDADSAYELGLYHNTGCALLFNYFDNYRLVLKSAYKHESGAIFAFEHHHLKIQHGDLGADLAGKWHLSDTQSEVIRHHHSSKWIERTLDESDHHQELSDMIAILKLAEFISQLPGYLVQVPVHHEWKIISEKIMDYFDLTDLRLERLKRIVKEGMAESKV